MNDSSHSTRSTVLLGTIAAAMGLVAMLFIFDPARAPIYPVCLFHRLTGLDCPGCGSLRATHALLHGQWAAAFQFNPMWVLSIPLLACIGLRLARQRAGKCPPLRIHPGLLWSYAGAWIVFSIARNLA